MRKLPRNIHRLNDGRFWVYTTRRGRPVRNIVSWELLTKLRIPVAAGTKSLQPGLALAKAALTKLQGVRLEERRSGAIDASAKVKISGLLPLMEADYLHRGYRSWDDAEARWKNHLRAPFGEMLASELTSDALNKYVAKRLSEGAEKGSINRELSVVRRTLKLGHAAGKLQNLVAFPHLKEENVRQGFLTEREYRLLLPHAQPLGIRGLLTVGYTYGFRRGELLDLRCRQCDLVNGTIELERKQCKNGEIKIVVMTSEVRNVLALCVAGKSADDRVLTWADGRPIRDFRETWKELFATAGVPLKLVHDLRRSAVKNMVERGVPTATAMQISGHRTMAVFQRYNIQSLDNLRDAALKIAKGAEAAPTTDDLADGQPKAEGTIQ